MGEASLRARTYIIKMHKGLQAGWAVCLPYALLAFITYTLSETLKRVIDVDRILVTLKSPSAALGFATLVVTSTSASFGSFTFLAGGRYSGVVVKV